MKSAWMRGRMLYAAYQAWWQVQTRRAQVLAVLVVPVAVVAVWLVGWHTPRVRQSQVVQRGLLEAQTQRAEQDRSTQTARQAHALATARLDQLRAEIAAARDELETLRIQSVPPEAMRERLSRLVIRSGRARWAGLQTAPVLTLPKSRLFRHPMALEIDGDFDELLATIQAIESEAQTVHWSGIDLRVKDYPALRARLDLYTLSEQKTWLSL